MGVWTEDGLGGGARLALLSIDSKGPGCGEAATEGEPRNGRITAARSVRTPAIPGHRTVQGNSARTMVGVTMISRSRCTEDSRRV